MNDKGQMSAELILIMAAVLSIAVLTIGSIKTTTNTADKKLLSLVKKATRAIK